MYKNKTLRGLAISAIVALGFSGLAAAPASANYGLADKSFISVAPSVGDEWSVFANGSFTVRATKAASLTVGTLKLLVEDVSGNVSATSSATVNATAGVMPSTYTGTLDGLTRKSSTDRTFVLAASTSGAVSADFPIRSLSTSMWSSSFEVKVTAWNDANLDGLIQSTEYASATETIKFVDGDAVAVTATLDRPVVGEPSLSAVVSTTPTLNHEMGANLSALAVADFDLAFNRAGYTATTSYTTSGTTTWNALDRNYKMTSPAFTAWSFTRSSNAILNGNTGASTSVSVAVAGTATVTTHANSEVTVGDAFTFATGSAAVLATVSKIVSAKSFEAKVSSTVGTFSAAVVTASAYVSVLDKVTAGTYGVTPRWKNVAGTASEFSTQAVVAADVAINVAGSANIQAVSAAVGTSNVKVKSGTTTFEVVATVLDADEEPVGAGRSVVVSNANRTADVRIDGKSGSVTLLTDANGQVKVTVTSTAGAAGTSVDLTFTPEGVSAAATQVNFVWEAAAFGLVDLSVANSAIQTTRAIVKGGSYDLELAVLDQWYSAPAATDVYRVLVTGGASTNGIYAITGGKTRVTVADNGTATSYTTTLTLQKQGTTGAFATVGTATTITTEVKTGAVVLGADKTALYGGVTVALSAKVAAKALVEADLRAASAVIPDYENAAQLAGKVRNATTGVAVAGATVTLTGPTSLLFNVGDQVYKRGSITVVADNNGEFAVKVYSTTAAKDVVVTVAALGESATTKLTFTGIGIGEGTKLDVTAPASVEPASTVQVKAKLTDAYGNAVEATAGRIKVSYTGPGIIFGTLPTSTDKDGELMFSALLGAADKGSITVVVSYDQNGDGDYVDAKDLNTTKTIAIATAPVVVPEVAAVIGSFNGRWAVRVENAKGAAVSVKVGGNWYKYTSLNENYLFSRKSAVGRSVAVAVYVNGTLENVATITVK